MVLTLIKILVFITFTSYALNNSQHRLETHFDSTLNLKQVDNLDIVDLTDYLPNGFVRDGSVDYTPHLQKGILENKVVQFPDFPVLINEKGLNIPSDRKIHFDTNSSLILKPTGKERYEILRVHGVKNVTFINPKIIGDRDNHLGTGGQWGMGISIRGSSDITVLGGVILDCWGDGIYIGAHEDMPSTNILLRDMSISNCRRNGISVTSGDFITVENTTIKDIGGQAPESSIDIEPNSNRDIINNIFLKNIHTFNSNRYGIILSFNRLIGHRKKEINIAIEGHKDVGSKIGFAISSINKGTKDNFEGAIRVSDCKWNSRDQAFRYSKHNYNLEISFENVRSVVNDAENDLKGSIRKIKGVRIK